ncbi:cyclopropane-fatty-acyl-phospholipid synthase [Thermobispora bispora]|uniref:Cyclopropane-fatty-acyl-phospholipid synthase n=1 Tax=Thermobispora bispora (strain ATCC 19993 / DSM 43833 / CBS 139.67 / JCM 10125 / KCTC 9307 / NBRC 14880 / R51) TaxID=469371 RepID=D6Y434_THEBD|nr:cyclopropane-fatty-acyl-phospholipid synthase family protein [Thermobispora bispora]MBO2474311.1 class I SAM-dependent methyltransferase [Actinomycetales bacterium]MDI9580190.1 cyclopropane-fatty-acyl-phospholipid synthase family protein [Thermobispora sp.]ADG89136.1 Cyclopropane-fatty-acyl-phospholipid synthase [Thermobispora bispora DSM 43833]MBX6167579.1 class I SAM-dependent methyltransferase [Thermobispora bispora]QSI48850.1 class I SAM-dependent methyltransferase [Thermobispora bispor
MRLAALFEQIVGTDTGVRFVAYDGSEAGPPDADVTIEVKSPAALAYLAQAPGELGLARGYVSGHIDVHGDLYTLLDRMWSLTLNDLPLSKKLGALRSVGIKPLLMRVEPPPQEVRRSRLARLGLRHAKRRDAEAIHHHYDVSNRFYEWVLGPSMAYTCAVFPRPDASLEEAQYTKFDLVAKKLDLKPGMRLLDVGCGWGGMVMHAAREYGVKALGVTLSRQQAEWAQKAIAEAGLSGLAEVRHMDYRDVPETGFDRISSIGLTEHIGKKNLPFYFGFLYRKLKPGGRLLNHCITRPTGVEKSMNKRGFINRYVFPDGELVSVGHLIRQMEDIGFEIRHQENLREHYALTLRHWVANLDRHWDEAVEEVGEGTARVWRLYMTGSIVGFERDKVQLHQVLAVRLDDRAEAHMPLRPAVGWP